MIVELFIVSKALTSLTKDNGSSFRPFSSSKSPSCPPCPKPSSAIYQIPLSDVPTFKELGLLVPTEARDRQPVTPKPIVIDIPTGLDLSGIDFTPTDTPAEIAARLKYGSGL